MSAMLNRFYRNWHSMVNDPDNYGGTTDESNRSLGNQPQTHIENFRSHLRSSYGDNVVYLIGAISAVFAALLIICVLVLHAFLPQADRERVVKQIVGVF